MYEKKLLPSAKLGRDVAYSVYLPAGYAESSLQYPVLYLLHGYSDDDSGWLQFGEAHLIADRLMGQGEVPQMILIMPDAGVSWYINDDEGKVGYEDFFVQELLPYIEANYRVRPGRRYRAVAGLSMGGYGSLVYALKHPGLFAACAPLSAAVYTDDEILAMSQSRWDEVMGFPFTRGSVGATRLSAHFRANNPFDLLKTTPATSLNQVRWYLDCGDGDYLVKANMQLHATMIDQQIKHEFRIRDGEHNWDYWRTALPEVFKFIGKSFRQ